MESVAHLLPTSSPTTINRLVRMVMKVLSSVDLGLLVHHMVKFLRWILDGNLSLCYGKMHHLAKAGGCLILREDGEGVPIQ